MSDRRTEPRRELKIPCPLTFVHEEQEHKAEMLNVSLTGAGILVFKPGWKRAPRVGALLPLRVPTPEGESRCVGKVVWVDAVTRGRRFGVSFEFLDAADPLRQLIEAREAARAGG